jgi:hypothetical protein
MASAPPRPLHAPQLALDEQPIEDTELEAALEERLRRQTIASETRKAFDEAHEAANAEIAKLELPEGGAVRCGRFRIARTSVAARHVAFDAKATSRVRISLIGEE